MGSLDCAISQHYRSDGEVGVLFREFFDNNLGPGCRWLKERVKNNQKLEVFGIEHIFDAIFGGTAATLKFSAHYQDHSWTDVKHRIEQMTEAWIIRSFQHYDVFDHLPAPDDDHSHIATLGTYVNVDEESLRKLLEVLVSRGVIASDGVSGFRNTTISSGYRRHEECGTFLKLHFDNNMMLGIAWIRDIVQRKAKLVAPTAYDNPFTRELGSDGTLPSFQWLAEKDENGFEDYMEKLSVVGRIYPNLVVDFDEIFQICKENPGRIAIVDVGGGNGCFLAELLEQYPTFASRAVLQDINPRLACENLPASVEKMVHNFFEESTIKGAYVYHIRLCLHDYEDHLVVQILRHLRSAMSLDSVLLIAENVLPEAPYVGACGFHLDCAMLNYGGKERSERMFARLLEQSGLSLSRVHLSTMPPFGTIEARLPIKVRPKGSQ